MKKTLLILLATLSLCQADLIRELKFGAGEVEAMSTRSTSYTIAFGATHYTDRNFLFGLALNLTKGDITLAEKKESMYSFCTDIKAGYALFGNKVSLHALGSALSNSTQSQQSYGFGYGAGMGYWLSDNVSLSLEYKTHRLSSDKVQDYDYETFNGFVSWVF